MRRFSIVISTRPPLSLFQNGTVLSVNTGMLIKTSTGLVIKLVPS